MWGPEELIPVYWFNSRESYMKLEDHGMLGLSKDYVEKHKAMIEAMIDYVEVSKKLSVKWLLKGCRTPKIAEKLYVT